MPTVLRRPRLDTPGLGLDLEELGVGPVDRVEVQIAYSEAPFEPQVDRPPDQMLEELRSWGTQLQVTIPVTEEPAESPRPPDDTE